MSLWILTKNCCLINMNNDIFYTWYQGQVVATFSHHITDILIRFITELLYLYFQNRWYDWIVLFRFILYQGSFSWNRNHESCLRTDFIHNMLLVLVIFFRLKTERPSTLYILNNEDLLMIKSNTWKWLQTHEEIFFIWLVDMVH